MARVEFEEVSKVFGDGTRAVDRLDLEIADGEFMVLVGPSGCGKTTALRMVAGLEDISDGVVRIGERVVNDLSPKSRDIAMVFQSYALYPHLSVRDNIAFPLKIAKVPKDEIRRRVDDGGADPRPRAVPQAQAARALGRPAAAGGDGPRDRPRAGGVPDGRAAVEPRREAPRADARGHQEDPERPRHDDDLRHARPGRGDDDGRPRRGHAQGRAAAGRAAAGALRPPVNVFVARLHRQPGDEHARGARRARRRPTASSLVLGDARLELDEPAARPRTSAETVVVGIRPEDLEDAALANGAAGGGSAAASSCARRSGRRCSSTSRSRRARRSPRTCASSPRTSATTASSGSSPERRAAGGDARRAVQPATTASHGDAVEVCGRPARAALLRPGDRARDPRRVMTRSTKRRARLTLCTFPRRRTGSAGSWSGSRLSNAWTRRHDLNPPGTKNRRSRIVSHLLSSARARHDRTSRTTRVPVLSRRARSARALRACAGS